MQWLAENWVWIVVFVVFIGLHMFGHGGHGGGGGCGGGGEERRRRRRQGEAERPSGHQH